MTKYLKNIPLLIVLINTIIAFLIDFYMGFSVSYKYSLIITLIEVPLIYVVFRMFDGENWAFILAIIYYFLRMFNFYFENFTLYTKNGINIEISFFDEVGFNIISVIIFILILVAYKKKKQH